MHHHVLLFSTYGSDGTLADALHEKPFFNLWYKIVTTSPSTEAPVETLNSQSSRKISQSEVELNKLCSKTYCFIC